MARTDRARFRAGPAAPEIGVVYPFDLLTHCRVDFARFGGRMWRTAVDRQPPRQRPDENGGGDPGYFTAGTMTLLDADTLRFVMDVRYVYSDDPVVMFKPTGLTPPLCK